jgi:cytochrome c-type biogenesis protein
VLLLLVAFVGGLLTVLSPCILPVLPVLLSGTVGGRGRPLGIVTGFVGSFVLFTLFLSTLVSALHLSPDALRWAAITLLLIFGLTLMVPALHSGFERLTARLQPRHTAGTADGFAGGLLLGATLGLIWTPCVGPVLASVITLALSNQVTAFAAAVTLAYALGVAAPMFAVMLGGQRLSRLPALSRNLERLQQVFGSVLVLFALGMVFGLDRTVQTYIVEHVPYVQGLTSLENAPAVQKELPLIGN